ncbi:hypothetical protein BC939DRAFT_458767 [Gamsiella multidivaricata]|uniref:uncharacterized protein n=1 Tax=Gamsiella multidivaricata TaxID=101098 RepID=UPI00221EF539|nr:uncharacterized protein BC939DRAFT_458767 [Gamsiella multidivaricata]KAI7820034.1 hypothetical protein BC939DRAFT_458767 [Gamsiella multidivaricata]
MASAPTLKERGRPLLFNLMHLLLTFWANVNKSLAEVRRSEVIHATGASCYRLLFLFCSANTGNRAGGGKRPIWEQSDEG